jgi:YegS/Rv2252/BmrU family lipid kinase
VAIVNPATHRPAESLIALLRERLPVGVALDVRVTERAGTTAEVTTAALPEADLVVAVGGDGTVAAVASAIGEAHAAGGRDVPLAILPAGSTNMTAKELRIPTNPERAVDVLYGRQSIALASMDLGACGTERFLHMAGAGLDSRIFAETSHALKRRVGWMAYVPPTVRNLRIPPARFHIVADEASLVVDSPLVIVANGGSLVVRAFQLYPEIRTDDGWFDVLIFTPQGLPAILRTLARTATLRLHRSPYVVRLRARRVELRTDPPVPVQLDGDVMFETPVTFTVQPSALRVVVPAGY